MNTNNLEHAKLERLRRAELVIRHRGKTHKSTNVRLPSDGNKERWTDPRYHTRR